MAGMSTQIIKEIKLQIDIYDLIEVKKPWHYKYTYKQVDLEGPLV